MDCSIPDTILQRKGATKEANIPVEVQQLLHSGMIESVNLTEWLAVDHITLLEHVLPEVGLEKKLPDLLLEIKETDSIRGMKAIRLIGQRLYQSCSTEDAPVTDSEPFMAIAEHRSDSVRCWGAYMAGGDDSMSCLSTKHCHVFTVLRQTLILALGRLHGWLCALISSRICRRPYPSYPLGQPMRMPMYGDSLRKRRVHEACGRSILRH